MLIKALSIVHENNIPLGYYVLPDVVIKNMTTCWGKCVYTKKGCEIHISRLLLDADEYSIMCTLIHEVLHTCEGCVSHKGRWKKYAKIITDNTPYDIIKKCSYSDKGVVPEHKYKIICKSCGYIYYRKNKCKMITNIDTIRCGVCKGELRVEKESDLKIGDYVDTPRFCKVRIDVIYKNIDDANANGYTEPTYYKGNFEIRGKSIGINQMVFAAIKMNRGE